MARTLYDKIWDEHVVHSEDDGTAVLYIDRHLVHEVTSPQAFEGLELAGRKVWRLSANLAVSDHNVPTTDRSHGIADPISRLQVDTLDANCDRLGITQFKMNDRRQGIVHVIGPEQGATLPGMTVVCGDSHTSTHGAFGALAHGIGTSEVEHVLATQTLLARKAKNMLVRVDGTLGARLQRQGHRARGHRQDRHRRRHRLHDRVRRQRDPRAQHGRPHDGLQHGDRGRRARRPDRRRRDDDRLPARAARTARAASSGTLAERYWRTLHSDADAHWDARRRRSTPPRSRPQVTWGTSPEMVRRDRRPRARSRARARPRQARRDGARARATWRSSRTCRSPTSASTRSSSARAPTRASRTCARRRPWCAGSARRVAAERQARDGRARARAW